MNQLRYAFAFFVFISIALPAKSELWGCSRDGLAGLFDEPHPHLIELVSNIEDGTGKIKIQGLPEIHTIFGIEGLARVWRWLDDNSSKNSSKKWYFPNYAFIMRDDYSGAYYEFRDDKTAKPVETYICHKH